MLWLYVLDALVAWIGVFVGSWLVAQVVSRSCVWRNNDGAVAETFGCV